MKKKYIRLGFLLMMLGSVGLLYGGKITKEFRKQYPFDPGGTVGVRNTNGNIYVESWEKNEVEIFAEIVVKAGSRKDAEEFMEKVVIQVDHDHNRLFVKPDYPKRRGGGLFDWLFGRRPQISVTFRIRVPSETDTEIRTTNGRVEMSDIKGRSELHSTNGGIYADNLQGTVDAHTVNGSIKVMLSKVSDHDRMSFKTTNGGIKLTLPDDIQADIEASTVNGGISTDFPLEVQGRFNRKKIRGTINGGGVSIDLRTVNGGITIYEE